MASQETKYLIDVPALLDQTQSSIESVYGAGVNIERIYPQELESLPEGGTCATYQLANYTCWLFFDLSGLSKGFQVVRGLIEEKHLLEDWPAILEKFHVDMDENANLDGKHIKRWDDQHGLKVILSEDPIDEDYVWSIQVWKVG